MPDPQRQNPFVRRRRFLLGLAATAGATLLGSIGMLLPRLARAAWPASAFAAKSPDQALRALFGEARIEPTDRIRIDLPELAEDGAVVPLTVATTLQDVRSISVIAEKNPVPLIARFDLGDIVLPEISTRIKLADSSNVTVVANAGGRLYSARRHIKVTHGGCD